MLIVQKQTIEVTKNELEAVIESLQCFNFHMPITRRAKVVRSALFEINKKITKKLLTTPKKNNRYSLKLAYYEMDFLDEYLTISLQLEFNQFCQSLKDKLDQKLA